MKKYEAYKDSEIEWVGVIPISWRKSKIKYLANSEGTLFIDGDWIESNVITEDGIRYITTGNVGEGFYKEQGSGYISEETFSKLNCTEVFEGDLLISRLNNPIGRSCIVPRLNKRIVTSVDNVILRPNENINKKYLLYLFSSKEYFEHTSLIARGATMQRISRSLLGNVKIPLPSKNDQINIANYLDRKTTQLDTLIAKKEKLIALLQEERTAIINHVVTKGLPAEAAAKAGLNPNVPMKDSGIEWLGEIPEHWEMKRLKHVITKIGSGVTPRGGAEVYQDSGIPLLRSQNIYFDGFYLDDVAYISQEIHQSMSGSKVFQSDVLINITGGSIGRCYYVTDEFKEANVNQHVCIVRPNSKIETIYLYNLLRSHVGQIQIEICQTGGNRESLNFIHLKNFSIPLPSIEEQKEILSFIRKKEYEINLIITKTKQEIELLKEYKTALISEVVTGKIDVRDEILN